MDKKVTYHEQTDVENTLRLRDVLKTLPPFCRDFFRAIEPRTTTKTRISYAYDIRIFFQFLLEQNPAFRDWSMDAFTVDVLDQIQAVDGAAVVKQPVDQALQVAEFLGLERSVFHSASLGAPRRHARRFIIHCDELNLSRLHAVAAVAVYT